MSGVSFEWMDLALSGVQSVAQRSKTPAGGGDVAVYSSRDGAPVATPAPLLYDAVKKNCTTTWRVPAETLFAAMNAPSFLWRLHISLFGAVVDSGTLP